MNVLLVDVGNTNIEWRLSGEVDLARCGLFRCAVDSSGFKDWLQSNKSQIDSVAVSSVQTETWNADLRSLCNELSLECWFAASATKELGLVSAYATPQHLGVDRWLAMLALWSRLHAGFLVVDAGTAITIDIVDNSGKHMGGYILPGLKMQRQVLLGKSSVLDSQVNDVLEPCIELGADTGEAIDNGVLASVVALLQKLISKESSWLDQVVFTGGDAKVLSGFFDSAVVQEGLVLEGLVASWVQYSSAGKPSGDCS